MKILTAIAFVLLASVNAQSQKVTESKNSFLDNYKTFINSSPDKKSYDSFFERNGAEMGLGEEDEFKLVHTDAGINGYIHYKYHQYYRGIHVYGSTYILHTHDKNVKSANGSYLPNIDLETEASISETAALEYAKHDMSAEIYSWEIENNKLRKNWPRPAPQLVIIDSAIPDFSGNYKLAYKFDLRSQVPFDAQTYFIDAHTGKVIRKIPLHHASAVPGNGKTKYYGEREFTVDSIAPSEFILRDPSRGEGGNTVYSNSMDLFTSSSQTFDLHNEDQDEVALDVHFMTAEFYDKLRDEFDWLGIDNMNGAMNSIIHAQKERDLVNAFWDGQFSSFGDGDCNHGPLTTYEILAHEFMHGIIDNTSQLVYFREAGYINESLCDIMGQYLENEMDPDNFSWVVGHTFPLIEEAMPFRVMDDPGSIGHPEYYLGPNWWEGAGVHYGSSLGNVVYAALSDGKTGTNLSGDDYNVTGIGRAEAAKFLFFVNRFYLAPTATYPDYYEACLLASEEYFPNNSTIKENLTQAWRAVGIPFDFGNEERRRLTIMSPGDRISCEWGEYDNAEFTIINAGSVPYLASSNGYVTIEADLDFVPTFEARIELTEDILPGESQHFVVDSFMTLDAGHVFLQYKLFADESPEITSGSIDAIYVTEHQKGDFSVDARQEGVACFEEPQKMAFVIYNSSCSMIEAGEKVTLFLDKRSTGEELWSEEIIIENDLYPRTSTTIFMDVELAILERNVFNARIENDNDPNEDNNTKFLFVKGADIIGIDYFNGFEDEDAYQEDIHVDSNNGIGNHLTQWNGSSQFYTEGSFADSDLALCHKAEENFESLDFTLDGRVTGFINAQIYACVDLTGIDDPALNFEMTHFRNDSLAIVSDYSSSVSIRTLQDGEETRELIYGLQEGQPEEFSIPLPSEFKGMLEMKFLNQTGRFFNSGPDLLDYDVIFMDNLGFNKPVSTQETHLNNAINLYPNPVTGTIYFSDEAGIENVIAMDIYGRIVLDHKNSSPLKSIDVSHLPPGCYLAKLINAAGKETQTKFIKL